MNARGRFKIVVRSMTAAVVILNFSGCTSTPQTRAQKNPEMLTTLSTAEQEMVMRGAVGEGMSRNAVYLAWGQPDSVSTGSHNGRAVETWRYATLRPVYPYFGGFGLGLGYGGYGGRHFYPGMAWNLSPGYVPVTSSIVHFRNGKVFGWESARR